MIYFFVLYISIFHHFYLRCNMELLDYYSMIKEWDGIIYIGGKNTLIAMRIDDKNQLSMIKKEIYSWPVGIMNGSDIGFNFSIGGWSKKFELNPKTMVFDTCLNWKQEHLNDSMREFAFDYQHWQYHTPSGDVNTMEFICSNSFIKSVENLDNDTLWVCGTFGAFPRAFSVNKTNLQFIKFVDVNVMSCARYMEEPMASYRDNITNDLYVASGWGLYRPDKKNADVPNNNSTMLYADWRLYRNLFTLPSTMAWVLSSDVNFINVIKEKGEHLYFFGYEINKQYGLNNQEDRNAWQSFLLRICKKDLGFKYVPTEIKSLLKHMTNIKYYSGPIDDEDFVLSPIHEDTSLNEQWYHQTAHLPTTHFVNAQKINFGCYMGKRPRAISDNHCWGETNVIYINKLADVLFDPNKRIKFKTKSNNPHFGCSENLHSQLPLIGIFNMEGVPGIPSSSVGALCQLQVNENIFNEVGSKEKPYNNHNIVQAETAYEEIMAFSSTSYSNFHSRTIHRTNGYTLYPFWNQGLLTGLMGPSYTNAFNHIGKCHEELFYKNMTRKKFLQIQNFSNTAWPNELPNRLSSIPSAICQYSAVELYSFNATFVISGVEFKKIILVKENYTNYHMHKLTDETEEQALERRRTSPLIIVLIVTNSGKLYRAVVCDFDNAILNYGKMITDSEWYNWCIFRYTDQPYLYRQYAPMENRKRGESYLYRASSLLQERPIVNEKDEALLKENKTFGNNVVKDVLLREDHFFVLTSNDFYTVPIAVDCGSYKTCIECASDPLCMWQKKHGKCITYDEEKYRTNGFMQDVLDRGFLCASIPLTTLNTEIELMPVLLLNCTNAGFWRGKIVWKLGRNGRNIKGNNKIFLSKDDTMMTITDYNEENYGSIFTCNGVKEDHDKLFHGKEYKWTSSGIVLNEFHIKKPPRKQDINTLLSILFIILLFILVLVIFNRFCAKPKSMQTVVHESR